MHIIIVIISIIINNNNNILILMFSLTIQLSSSLICDLQTRFSR